MSDTRFDVLVLGAGMVGTATAAHLALKGVKVALVDKQAPGEGTSYGNAGVIDSSAFVASVMPRDLVTLVRQGLGLTPHVRVDPFFVPRIAGWLWRYWRESAPDRVMATAARLAPLASHAVAEHRRLAEDAGASALLRDTGWMHLYRSDAGFRADAGDRDLMRRYGVAVEELDGAGVAALEPHLSISVPKAVWIRDSFSTSDPGALTKAYAALMESRGGRLLRADALALVKRAEEYALATAEGPVFADQVVVALGPWAPDLLKGFGIEVPIAIKRGYHMHYTAKGNATLSRPIVDVENGYCLTPMMKGIRLTTGAEFADRDAPPNPAQVDHAETFARGLFPLDQRAEPTPWMGRRPNTPDGVPIIGPAPRQSGMWLAVGHGHWGLGLGAVTGRLVSELVTGATPLVDPRPLGIERFG